MGSGIVSAVLEIYKYSSGLLKSHKWCEIGLTTLENS